MPGIPTDTIHEAASHQRQLIDLVGESYDDPLSFVISCFPWGEPGPLRSFRYPTNGSAKSCARLVSRYASAASTG
jgi:hypothetical protein